MSEHETSECEASECETTECETTECERMDPTIQGNALGHVSHSQLSLWEKCPRAWEYRYVEKIKTPKSWSLFFGDVYHHALECYYINKMRSSTDYTQEELNDLLSDYWNKQIDQEQIDWKEESPDRLKGVVVNLINKYIEEVAPLITPIKVEEWFYSKIEGVKFLLRMDLMDESGAVIDHKTAAKSYPKDRIDKDDQATACSFVLQKPIIFYNHVAVKTNTPKIQICKTFRTQDDVDWWYDKAARIILCMKAGLCPPRTDTWYCDRRYCEFYESCRGHLRY